MRRMMQSYGVSEVTMESTAVYWIPVWRVLEPHFHLKLVNPYFIKQLPGRKSDVKDAQWIAEENRRDRCLILGLSESKTCSPHDSAKENQ